MNFVFILLNLFVSSAFANNEIQLPACRSTQVADAVADSIEHIKGFQEIRHYLDEKQSRGAEFCYEGLTLDKNIYQYYKNLVVVYVFQQGQLIQRMMILFQVASIQAHHGTAKRPWIVLDSQEAFSVLNNNWDLPVSSVSTADLYALPDEVYQRVSSELGAKKETSSLYLGSSQDNSYFLITWLKEINAGSSVFTGQVSPQYSVVSFHKSTQKTKVVRQGSAYDLVLKKLEDQLKSQQKDVSADALNGVVESLSGL